MAAETGESQTVFIEQVDDVSTDPSADRLATKRLMIIGIISLLIIVIVIIVAITIEFEDKSSRSSHQDWIDVSWEYGYDWIESTFSEWDDVCGMNLHSYSMEIFV